MMRKPVAWVLGTMLILGAAFGLYWFEPWRLVTSTTVSDTLSRPLPAPSTSSSSSASSSASAPAAVVEGPVVVRQGQFITHEHDTSGTVRLVRNPDGTHQIELVGLSTSDGPDLRVWLTDREVVQGTAGWKVFDDGRYVELGKLKGNRGDQVYVLATGVDPAGYRSVSIWCKRFSVSFGAATLA